MTFRQQNGLRSGVYGGWISKPGFDVTTCNPGDFLLDTNAQIYQCVLTGDTLIMTEMTPPVPAGAYSVAVGLPSAFAPYSNLIVAVVYYTITGSGTVAIGYALVNGYLKHNTVSGVLNLTVVLRGTGGGWGIPANYLNHRARWSVFRAQF